MLPRAVAKAVAKAAIFIQRQIVLRIIITSVTEAAIRFVHTSDAGVGRARCLKRVWVIGQWGSGSFGRCEHATFSVTACLIWEPSAAPEGAIDEWPFALCLKA